jgi:hypothetical protein
MKESHGPSHPLKISMTLFPFPGGLELKTHMCVFCVFFGLTGGFVSFQSGCQASRDQINIGKPSLCPTTGRSSLGLLIHREKAHKARSVLISLSGSSLYLKSFPIPIVMACLSDLSVGFCEQPHKTKFTNRPIGDPTTIRPI